nr:kinesin-like protein KIF22 isoform X2 [Tanacetum cinerariifolium]
FSDLDTFSSVRRPRHRDVIWKKKESSNTSNVCLPAVSVSNLNENVKRYSRKDLLACNNSHLGGDSWMNDLLDDNNFFIFDGVNVRISPVSKMPFRKKLRDSMQVRSKSNMIKSLPITVHKWLPKLQALAKPVAKCNVFAVIASYGEEESLVQDYLRFLNSASKDVLKSVRGIGEKRATYILDLREESPEPFKSLDDLQDIGLSAKQVKKMMKNVASDLFP